MTPLHMKIVVVVTCLVSSLHSTLFWCTRSQKVLNYFINLEEGAISVTHIRMRECGVSKICCVFITRKKSY